MHRVSLFVCALEERDVVRDRPKRARGVFVVRCVRAANLFDRTVYSSADAICLPSHFPNSLACLLLVGTTRHTRLTKNTLPSFSHIIILA